MKWSKKGLIFDASNGPDWMASHTQVPFVEQIAENRLRIYFGTRDMQNRTVTAFIEVDAENPQKVLYVHDEPVLSLGKLGCFDDSGAMPSWVINIAGKKHLFYTGWNQGVTVPYRNCIGVAVSVDGGYTFERCFDGPIIDRTSIEPYISGTPCVLGDDGFWQMWYLSGTGWEVHEGHPEPYYHIKYAESEDGLNWVRTGKVAIDYKTTEEGGLANPSVLKEDGIYKMWYSYRGGSTYRTNTSASYRIGYAESQDGITWVRKDEEVGIGLSEKGWDSEMIAYPHVVNINGNTYMFYNGNGFGKSGIGYAVLEA